MSIDREQEAINAYFKILRHKGAQDSSLKRRIEFLNKLVAELKGVPHEGTDYRLAVNRLMDREPGDDWPYNLTIVRQYYPFWKKDMKSIAALNSGSMFEIEAIDWRPANVALNVLWDNVDSIKLELTESWPLKAYIQALKDEGSLPDLVETRAKLAKILLARLKDAPVRDEKIYRLAVDATLPLFSLMQNRRLFQVVVREFFYFWEGHPEAASYVLKETRSAAVF